MKEFVIAAQMMKDNNTSLKRFMCNNSSKEINGRSNMTFWSVSRWTIASKLYCKNLHGNVHVLHTMSNLNNKYLLFMGKYKYLMDSPFFSFFFAIEVCSLDLKNLVCNKRILLDIDNLVIIKMYNRI